MTPKPSYFPEDADEDTKVDKAFESGAELPEVTMPPDFEAAENAASQPLVIPQEGEPVGVLTPVGIAALSDDELAAELARRKTAKIDLRIIEVQALLASLMDERARLMADPLAIFDAAAFSPGLKVNIVTAEQSASIAPTDINPVTGKRRAPKVRPGSLRHAECDCRAQGIEGGCYRCLASGAITKLGSTPRIDEG